MSNNIERRTYTIELRKGEGEDNRSVTGYAAIYDSRSQDLGGFYEEIAPGAFDEAINTSDVRALVNHDPNKILARSNRGEGTLQLTVDNNGLGYRFSAPDTTAGNDLLVSLQRGDISESSFGFTVNKDDQEWREENGVTIRTIKKVNRLFDVSPVTYPAYLGTTANQRSIDATAAIEGLKEFRAAQKPKEQDEKPNNNEYWKRYLDLQ
jgi:uncharacterized protein